MTFKTLLIPLIFLAIYSCSPKVTPVIYDATDSYNSEILTFQKELNAKFSTPSHSPLSPKQLKKFKSNGGHDFFPITTKFRIEAELDRTSFKKKSSFQTSKDKTVIYDVYGVARFHLGEKEYSVNLYQSEKMKKSPEYKDKLFFPFNDLTNGEESYGGGRYLDLIIPDGNTIIIDFNKSYNPYCAYSDKYSCPIPPKENFIDYEVRAGIRFIK